jgi:hypothetical protein
MEMTTESVTRKEACELIRGCIGKDMPEGEAFDKIVFAVNNDMQEVISFLCHMANETQIGEDIPFVVVSGAIAYETGHLEEFYKHAGYASVHAPEYGLNRVLMKAASAGYPGKMLTKMREELHVKVMENCYKTQPDFIITETGDKDGQYISSDAGVSTSSENTGQETSGQAESGSIPNTQS